MVFHDVQDGRRSMSPFESSALLLFASMDNRANSSLRVFSRCSAFTTSPVSAKIDAMFLKLNTLRASAKAVTSSRPTRKPLLTRMSTTFCHGICELLIGSSCVPISPSVCRGAWLPAPLLRSRVYGRPLNTRKSANRVTSRSALPRTVFCCQSFGTVIDTLPTML